MDYIHSREDLEVLHKAFILEGKDYENNLSLNKEQFSEALVILLGCGSREEYGEFFDKIDTAKEGTVDWDKFAGYMLLEFYERDDHLKSTQVIQWQDIRILSSPHKDVIQKVLYLKNIKKYIIVSKEGFLSMWDLRLKVQRTIKIMTESCSAKDLWITSFVPLQNINKIALSFTSKEIAIYDFSTQLDFNCQYKIQGLGDIPLCLDYWSNAENPNEAILLWGDAAGFVTALHFTSANIALFERPSAPAGEKQDTCIVMQLKDIANRKFRNVQLLKTHCHNDWVRQVLFIPNLECFLSCSTTWNNSLVLGWMEKNVKDAVKLLLQGHRRPVARHISRKSVFQISQGVNSFDYHEKLNLIASAGVNNHVCLWNPYVISKPTGLLRGHMTSVVQVKFIKSRGQLASFSKDKVLRIWDVQLQVCIQRLAGMFPKGQEVSYSLYFDECMTRLFLTFNSELTVLEMKHEIKAHLMSHSKPIVGVLYNRTYGQVVSASKDGTLCFWLAETGKKVKQLKWTHGKIELTCLAQDVTETRLLTGALDGTIKMWDFNGHCYHTMKCQDEGQSTDIAQILSLKRKTLVVGWTRNITVFREKNFEKYFVDASEWIGSQLHDDDILALAFSPPTILASGSYNGEIIIWNNDTEQSTKRFQSKSRKIQPTRRMSISTQEDLVNGHALVEESSQGRSSALQSASGEASDDQELESHAVLCLCFLSGRSVGANLVSCGGSGWVRFWSTANVNTNPLVAEFVAHEHAGNIIMAVDKTEKWLVTGDQDGLIKVWDIVSYCTELSADLITKPPDRCCQFQPHVDVISSLEVFERNERTLILSASADCSVQLSDIEGNAIGCFGQEEHWKIEPVLIDSKKQYTERTAVREKTRLDGDWVPDERAVQDPASYRINTWDKTCLGKEYQELRVQKRERKQPSTIPDLPYLYWEHTRKPPAGPHAALRLTEMKSPPPLSKPDFFINPHRYFAEQSTTEKRKTSESSTNPIQTKSLQACFDEGTIFPQHLLDHEAEARLKYPYPKVLPAQAVKKSVTVVTKPTNIGSAGAPSNHGRSSSQQKTKNGKRQV